MSHSGNEQFDWLECDEAKLPDWWHDWQAQMRNALRTPDEFLNLVTLNEESESIIKNIFETRRIQLTPYFLRLIRLNSKSKEEMFEHALWRQTVPQAEEPKNNRAYDGETENWEVSEDMVTPIAQNKYGSRVIIRVANECFSYCQFCFEALRTLEKSSLKRVGGKKEQWEKTLEYLKANPELEEIILSGGEPLLLGDRQLEKVLTDIKEVSPKAVLRIHTRALTFNPFRVTDELCSILKRFDVRAIGLHVTHPGEFSDDFWKSVTALRERGFVLLANTPLLRSINDEVHILRDLFQTLYRNGVLPYYLYHYMPNSPGEKVYGLPVSRGVSLMQSLDRRISGAALPKYVLPHHTGKFSVPVHGIGENSVEFTRTEDGDSVVRFKNWLGNTVEFLDSEGPEAQVNWPEDILAKSISKLNQSSPFTGFQRFQQNYTNGELINAGNNEPCMPPSPAVVKALADSAELLGQYPDPEALELRVALSLKYSVKKEEIVVGAGIDDLIGIVTKTIVSKGDRVLALDCTYPTFFFHARSCGADIRTMPYDEGRFPLANFIDAIKRQRPKLVYIANPDNPTGFFLKREDLEEVISALPQSTILLLDEAYLDFVSEDLHLPQPCCSRNVLRLRTFSKYYGFAGLRIGFMIGDEALINAMDRTRLHFGVNAIAQSLAALALKDEDYYREASRLMKESRERIREVVEELGFVVYPSEANFVLVKTDSEEYAINIQASLLERGVFIRKPVDGSLKECIRISVPKTEEEETLIGILRDVLLERANNSSAEEQYDSSNVELH